MASGQDNRGNMNITLAWYCVISVA